MDYSALFNTKLSPEQEAAYQAWAQAQGKSKDVQDYDLRGLYSSQQSLSPEGHGSDEFKKPNHPTFSDQSQHSTPEMQGGQWNPNENQSNYFEASPLNTIMRSPEELQDYFTKVEPDVQLRFPELRKKLR